VSTQAQLDPAQGPRTTASDPADPTDLTDPTDPTAATTSTRPPGVRRRSVLRGACVVCVGVAGAGVLAACGGGSSDGDSADAGSGGDGAGAAGGSTIKTSDIPVGGGKVFESEKIVVTQPTAGEFKAFTAVCTHERFTVGNVQGGTINCLHHGSMFNMTTGAVEGGPAPSPLAAKTVTVNGDSLTVA
jgi:nitrite reductase/ring-hydroxylating ferredoxin subunit